ncbi:hypothetical protein [Sorangium atrum]|uniref:Membrane protein 6-pyruvoyl-tetrahydropterin synthase-related domain-containing protein n=1 Tax=Sorangium atrum TaxID=2995308 RepID=A0ABT5CK00_9BACT|nr:hypothetical protein [Sorangium aterium]MDC0685417.1 hypothetical protein [Sorangium aterium]
MLYLLLALGVLVLRLAELRAGAATGPAAPAPAPAVPVAHGPTAPVGPAPAASVAHGPAPCFAWLAAAAAVAVALLPALRDAPALAGPGAALSKDTISHLAIAYDIATSGLPHGWIATNNGGFPIALHYPPVGWLLVAALIRLGVAPVVAVKGLGFAAFVGAPLVVLAAARAVGARPASAAAGAVALAWVAPYVQFAGGWPSFFLLGLLSQILVIPLVIAWAAAVIRPARFELGPALAAACAATHPQVFTVSAAVLGAAAIAAWDRRLCARVLRSLAGGGLVAVALYGPGIASMAAPFGWPAGLGWRHIGFGPERVLPWMLDGDLLDYEHAPVIGSAWIASCFLHATRLRAPASRAVLAASAVALLLSMSGGWIVGAGPLGRALLSLFQPMRALALLPLVAAAAILSALDLAAAALAHIGAALAARGARRSRPAVAGLLPAALAGLLPAALALVAAVEIPARAADLHVMAEKQAALVASRGCPPPAEGFDPDLIARWLAEAPPGRASYAVEDEFATCSMMHAADLRRAVPMAASTGAGAHVGVHAAAFLKVAPERPGSAARAEALGIRTLIHLTAQRPGPPEAWALVDRRGEVELSRRVGGTDYVGLGCVREVWRGREADLLAALFEHLEQPRTVLDTPGELVALEATRGPLERVAVADDGCDAARASVREVPREPGAYEATVDAEAPVDVVFRATAYSGWRVRDGGVELASRRVAPGFFAVRIGPGQHHLEAVVALPRFYLQGLALACGAAIALGAPWLRRPIFRRGRLPVTERR